MTGKANNEVNYYLFTERMVEYELCSSCQWTTCTKSSDITLKKLLYTLALPLLINKSWEKDGKNSVGIFYCTKPIFAINMNILFFSPTEITRSVQELSHDGESCLVNSALVLFHFYKAVLLIYTLVLCSCSRHT